MYHRRLEKKEGSQLSYDLPHRLHAACVYPRRSRNGSTVIIYGHEKGLRIVWYGGRGFKQTPRPSSVNGASIDLTDSPIEEEQEYEEDKDDGDCEDVPNTDSDILTYHDVTTSVPCTRIAVLSCLTSKPVVGSPEFLDSRIVVAVTGPDQSVKIITTLLDPTQKPTTPRIVSIKQSGLHQDLIQDVSITLTADLSDEEEDVVRSESGARLQGSNLVETSTVDAQNWSLLLASVSHTGHGLLVVHQIPISTAGLVPEDTEEHIIIQRCHLRSSFGKSQTEFSSARYPAESHSYLTCTNSSGIKVFQTLPKAKFTRQRRASNATNNSSLSSTKSTIQVSSASTRPLITLLAPFASYGPHDLLSRRKQVLDSAWVLSGRAIVVLLEDGEWGVWDLQAAGPSSDASSNNLVKGQKNVAGIHGGSLTRFAISGNISSGSQLTKKSSTKASINEDQALAPMTPHTRKSRSGELFKGAEPSSAASPSAVLSSKGKVTVVTSYESSDGHKNDGDETIIFSYGSANMVLNSLQSYWRSGLSGRSVFENVATNRPVILPTVLITGEQQILAQLLPADASHTGIDPSTSLRSRKLAVFSATRMIVFSPRVMPIKPPQSASLSKLPARLAAARSDDVDQVMLESGELSLDGVDRMLDNMAQGSNDFGAATTVVSRKQVGFQFDQEDVEEDIEMENSPTVTRSTKSKLTTIGNQPRRQLFI